MTYGILNANDDHVPAITLGSKVTVDVLSNDEDTHGPITVTRINQVSIDGVEISASDIAKLTTITSDGHVIIDTAKLNLPNKDYNFFITYVVTDPTGATDSANIYLPVTKVVTPVNHAPDAVDDHASIITKGATVTVNVLGNDTDADGDKLKVTGITKITVDGKALTTAEIAKAATVTADGHVVIDTSKIDHANVDYNLVATYAISDGKGGTDTANIYLPVSADCNCHPVNHNPNAVDDTANIITNGVKVTVAPLVNDTDPDGDKLTVTGVTKITIDGKAIPTADIAKIVTITSDGHVIFDTSKIDHANVDYNLVATYAISDGKGGTDTANIYLPVSAYCPPAPVNHVPNANDDHVTAINNGTSVVVAPLTNDTDPDGDKLTVTGVTKVVVDGKTLTAAQVSSLVKISADGHVTFDTSKLAHANTAYDIVATYAISDGKGGTDSANIYIPVKAVNHAPDAKDDTVTAINNGASVTVAPLANDTDPDGDKLTVTGITKVVVDGKTLTAAEVAKLATITADGHVVFNTATLAHANTAYNIVATYAITDGKGGTDSANITIPVKAINHAPDAKDDLVSAINNGASVTVAPLANDTDPDGDKLTITGITKVVVDGKTLTAAEVAKLATITADGHVVFNTATLAHANTAYNIVATYAVSDGKGGTDSANITIPVKAINHAPDAVDDHATAINNGASAIITALGNDTDPDGDKLTITGITKVTVGGVTLSTADAAKLVTINASGQVVFNTAVLNHANTAYDIVATYAISDGKGGTDTANIYLPVKAINHAPDAKDDNVGIITNGDSVTVAPLTNDTDPDGDKLTVTGVTKITIDGVAVPAADIAKIVTITSDGHVIFNTTKITHANTDFNLVATYAISDGHGGTDTANIYVPVSAYCPPVPVNHAPDAKDDLAPAINNGASVTVAALANDTDPDGDKLTITGITKVVVDGKTLTTAEVAKLVSITADGHVVFNTSTLAHANTDYNIVATYTISDGHGGTDSANITVPVKAVNHAPDAKDDLVSAINNGASVTVAPLANDTDPDGDKLTITGITKVVVDGKTLTAAEVAKLATITADGHVVFNTATLAHANTAYNIVATYAITDGKGGTDSANITIPVKAINHAPDAKDDLVTAINNGTSVTVAPLANDTDPDGDKLTITGITKVVVDGKTLTAAEVAKLATITADGHVVFNTATLAHANTAYNIVATYAITDGKGGTDSANITIPVKAVNHAPDAKDDLVSAINNGTSVTVAPLTNDTDPDGDKLTITGITKITVGGVTLSAADAAKLATITADGHVVFNTSTLNHANTAYDIVATYAITDGKGGTDSANITIPVKAINHAPDAVDDHVNIITNGDTVTVAPLVNDTDPDGDKLTVTAVTKITIDGVALSAADLAKVVTITTDGHVIFNTSKIPHDTTTDYNLVATYSISDGHGGTDSANIYVPVSADCGCPPAPVNHAPDAVDDLTAPINNGASITVAALANDTDPDGDKLTITGITKVVVGGVTLTPAQVNQLVTITADGHVVFNTSTLAHNNTDYNIVATYTISDGHGGTDSANITVPVKAVNHAPDAVDDHTASITNGATIIVAPLVNDTDPDGDKLTVTGITKVVVDGVTLSAADAAKVAVITADGHVIFDTSKITHTNTAYDIVATYTISDGKGGTDSANIYVPVAKLNHGPDAVDDHTATITNGSSITVAPLANDTDVDGDALSITSINSVKVDGVTLSAADAAKVYTVTADGHVVFDTSKLTHANTAYNIVANYTISDGHGGSDSADIYVPVSKLNHAPDAVDDHTASVVNGSSITVAPLTNDTDPDGDALTITAITKVVVDGVTLSAADAAKVATLTADGHVVFDTSKTNHANTAYDIVATYTISDGHGGTDSANIYVPVGKLNHAPDAVDDHTATITNGSSITVAPLANDTDSDGDALSITSINSVKVDGVTLSAADAAKVYTITADGHVVFDTSKLTHANTAYNIVANYTITDGHGGSDSADIYVPVSKLNHGPDAVDDHTASITNGASITVAPLANDTDIDGDALTITAINSVTVDGVTLSAADAAKVYTITADGHVVFDTSKLTHANTGYDIVANYTISDGHGGTDSANIYVPVSKLNHVPDAIDDHTASVVNGSAITVTPLANDTDPDGDLLVVTAINSVIVDGVTLSAADAAKVYTITADGHVIFDTSKITHANTAYNIVANYSISDGHGGTDSANIFVPVTKLNHGPDAIDDHTASIVNGSSITVAPLANDTDIDGDALSITSINSVKVDGVTLSAADAAKVYTITADGHVIFDTTKINHVNSNYNIVANYTITDGHGGSDSADIYVPVTKLNHGPDAVDDHTASIVNGSSITVAPLSNDTDIDGDALTITAINSVTVDGVTLSAADAAKVYTITADGHVIFDTSKITHANTAYDIVANYTITDGHGGSDSANIFVPVTKLNHGPDAVDDHTASIVNGSSITAAPLTNDTDPDGDTLTIVSINSVIVDGVTLSAADAAKAAVLTADGHVIFDTTKINHVNAAYDIVANYTISDGHGGTDSANIFVPVTKLNHGPDAVDDHNASIVNGSSITVAPLTNDTDPDGDALTITAITKVVVDGVTLSAADAAKAAVITSDGHVIFDTSKITHANTAYNIVATYTISDGHGGTDAADIYVPVTPLNHAPDAVDDHNAIVAEGTVVNVAPLVNDTDPDGDPLTVTGITKVTVGGVTLSADDAAKLVHLTGGHVIFDTSVLAHSPTDYDIVATYAITDGRGGTDTANIYVPVASSPLVNYYGDAPSSGISLTSDDAIATNTAVSTVAIYSGYDTHYADNTVNLYYANAYGDLKTLTLSATSGDATAHATSAATGGTEYALANSDAVIQNNNYTFGNDNVTIHDGKAVGDVDTITFNIHQGNSDATYSLDCVTPFSQATANAYFQNNTFTFGNDTVKVINGIAAGDIITLAGNAVDGTETGNGTTFDSGLGTNNTFNFGNDHIILDKGTAIGDIQFVTANGTVSDLSNATDYANFTNFLNTTGNHVNYGHDTFTFDVTKALDVKVIDFGIGGVSDKLDFHGVNDNNSSGTVDINDLLAISKVVNDGSGHAQVNFDINHDSVVDGHITFANLTFDATKTAITDYIHASDILVA